MPIKSTTISDDVFKSDKDLTVDVLNTYEYSFDSELDKFIEGFTGPAPFVGTPSSDIISDGYEPRLVFTEDIEVDVFLDGSSSPFHTQVFTFNYYIERKSSSTGDGTGGFDGGVDGGTGGSGGNDDGLSTDGGEDVDGGTSGPDRTGDGGSTGGGTTFDDSGGSGGTDGSVDNGTDETFNVA